MPRLVTPIDIAARGAWPVLRKHGVRSLLSRPISNPKVAKNAGVGVLTAPLHLLPADLSGWNVCPMATEGCKRGCLHTAGNPAYMAGKRRSRRARTRAYFLARDAFMVALAADIQKLQRKARRENMRCGVRLNATSDIVWERMPVTIGERVYPNLMAMFPDVLFYDYTKRPNRKNLPRNYYLTFSLAEGNDAQAAEALDNGFNVAAVFRVKRGHPLPKRFQLNVGPLWHGPIRVIDGDAHDFRPIDPRGVIVGLRAKGEAIKDRHGFVRDALSV